MDQNLVGALSILSKLKENGFDAYIVGGFVRDYLLGLKTSDIDITTSAKPDEVETFFDRVKHTGKKFGGVTVWIGENAYEVTTFRKEGKYVLHRYPSEVSFSKTVEEDVIRRDFTINALLMDEDQQILDYVGGKKDLSKQLIRAIGNPKQRFTEDALRILRAFRFQAKLGFEIEIKTKEAIKETANLIQTISVERLIQELNYLIPSPHRTKAFQTMIETGVHKYLPSLTKGTEHLAHRNDILQPTEFFIICFILEGINDYWRLSKKQLYLIKRVIDLHEITKKDDFNKMILFSNKLDICLLTNKINVLMGYEDKEKQIRSLWDDMPVHDVCDLAFKGEHIMKETPIKNARFIGMIIDDLLLQVLNHNLENKYEILKKHALKKVQYLQSIGDDNE